MPCNSDYLNATKKEIAISHVACLLDELKGKPIDEKHWRGYHPSVYNKQYNADALVAELCEKLQKINVTKQSLEMQIWWRDHLSADKVRLEKEIEDRKAKDAAIKKLTAYERKVLGL